MEPSFHAGFLGRDDYVLPSPGNFPESYRRPLTPRLSQSPPTRSHKFTNQLPTTRKITPPEEHPAKSLRPPPASNIACETYEDKLAMVKRLNKERLERPVSLNLSSKEFTRLLEDTGYERSEQRYPRYSFDALTSTMIVQCMPSPVHELIPSIFLQELHESLANLPATLKSRIHTAGTEDMRGFQGKYAGSQKAPDLSIKFRDADGKRRLKCVFEVGFSENYEDLVQDARRWLEGKESVVLVILAKYEEIPRYQNPFKNLSDTQLEDLDLPDSRELEEDDFDLEGEYGPVVYKGLRWVGKISSALLEIWRRDPLTKLAERDGEPVDLLDNGGLYLNLSDFLGVNIDNDRQISIRSEMFQSRIKDEMRALALIRCQKACDEYATADDHDYEPDSSVNDED